MRWGEICGMSHDAAIATLRQRVEEERRRAERAELIAISYEESLDRGPEQVRDMRARMAALHRRMEVRHRTSALLHELHAVRLEVWRAAGGEPAAPPGFMSTVAAAIGVPSATAAMRGRRPATVVASSSDDIARAAHDLEVTLGEGPALAAMAEAAPVSAADEAMAERWPLFGPAVAELGVRTVHAVPLRSATVCLGTLCVYGQEPELRDVVAATAGQIAEAVTHTVLLGGEDPDSGGLPPGQLFGSAEYQPRVHQAAGVVAAQCGCGIDDAEALLRARAFAESRPLADIAAAVLCGETRLG
jgi:ANTAR domain-containing protein